MATLPPGTPSKEHPTISQFPHFLKAKYNAAVAAFRAFAISITPTRKEYDQLFYEHSIAQSRHDKTMDKIVSHHTAYISHKQYFVSLCNALLASNNTMRTAPKPLTDSQALSHATLIHDMRRASDILTNMIYVTKRLEKTRDAIGARDLELYNKCQEMWKQVDSDCAELDHLHGKVVEAEKKLGTKPACGMAEGECVHCVRTEEKEADKVAAEKAKNGKGKKGKKGQKGKGPEVKQKLDDILEEVE